MEDYRPVSGVILRKIEHLYDERNLSSDSTMTAYKISLG